MNATDTSIETLERKLDLIEQIEAATERATRKSREAKQAIDDLNDVLDRTDEIGDHNNWGQPDYMRPVEQPIRRPRPKPTEPIFDPSDHVVLRGTTTDLNATDTNPLGANTSSDFLDAIALSNTATEMAATSFDTISRSARLAARRD